MSSLLHLHRYVGFLPLPLYFLATLMIGWFARGSERGSRAFLNAGRSLPLPIVVAAYVAANCGALEVVGLSAVAAQYGVQAFQFYWVGAIPAIIFLALWMMPVYRRSGISSVPEYLEKRFGARVRLLNACIVALILLLVAGISLYAMGEVLVVFTPMSFGLSIAISAAVVLAYVSIGGIRATIYNEVFQLAVMLAGLVPLAYRCFRWRASTANTATASTDHLWTTLPLASMHAPMDVVGTVLGLGFVLSFGYWCTDFVQMQRAFTARTDDDARQVPLWAGFGKILFGMLIVLAGLTAARLFPEMAVSQHYDQAMPRLMTVLYGPAMLSLGMTAIVASLMSGLAGNVSAFASVATNDIYRAHFAKNVPDRHYMRWGRWMTLAAILFSLGASYINFLFHNLMEHIQMIFAIFAAPFWAIFLLGIGTKRADERGAILGFLSGSAVAVLHVIAVSLGWLRYGSTMNSNFHAAIYAFAVALLVGIFASKESASHEPATTLVFRWRVAGTPRRLWFLAGVLAATCAVLNYWWR